MMKSIKVTVIARSYSDAAIHTISRQRSTEDKEFYGDIVWIASSALPPRNDDYFVEEYRR